MHRLSINLSTTLPPFQTPPAHPNPLPRPPLASSSSSFSSPRQYDGTPLLRFLFLFLSPSSFSSSSSFRHHYRCSHLLPETLPQSCFSFSSSSSSSFFTFQRLSF
ncbi:hypothetical protein E2C01_064587 [Portunus trituberculatus]|uniref:Uncharacterized protein n=1 Tax=Portunus trituberculatus TaxID=210409 RepID=A0A5B7HP67_PORTR|nr:hypothetical protein [Portunus trituberculatus]